MSDDLRAAIDEVREFANMDDKHERWRNVLLAVCAAAAERAGEPTRHPCGHLIVSDACVVCARPPLAAPVAAPADDLERECADADRICAALGLTVEQARTEGGSLNVPRIVAHIQETLTALRESHAFGVAMSDKYVASRAPECAAAQKPVAWATPSLLVTLSAVEKNHLTNPDRRTRGGEFESAAADAERYSVPLYAAPPAQAEPQEGDLLHTMMEWARTEEGRKQLADSYRPHLWACAKRVADPQNEAATCRHWCGDIEHCQPIASAPAQAEPRTIPAHVQPATLSPPTDWDDAQPEPEPPAAPADDLVELARRAAPHARNGPFLRELADALAALRAENGRLRDNLASKTAERDVALGTLAEQEERAERDLAAARAALRELIGMIEIAAVMPDAIYKHMRVNWDDPALQRARDAARAGAPDA